MPYYKLCDQIFADWIADKLNVSGLIRSTFNLQYSPEPYLRFGNQTNPIAFVTWNPGVGLHGQLKGNFDSPRSAFTGHEPYRENAIRVGAWYSGPRSPIRKAAQTRIKKMIAWARELDCSGVVQFDLFPFHSPTMVKNEKLIRALHSSDYLLRQYSKLLSEELMCYPYVVAISGGSSIRKPSVAVQHFATQVGMDLGQAQTPIILRSTKNGPSSFILWQRHAKRVAAISCMKGSNNLASNAYLSKIIAVLKT